MAGNPASCRDVFPASNGPGASLPEETEIPEVDTEANGLAGDEDRIAAMHGVDQEHQPAQQAEIPESGRHHAPFPPLTGEPLNNKAHGEEELAGKPDGYPIRFHDLTSGHDP
jgi:hypothetical protein